MKRLRSFHVALLVIAAVLLLSVVLPLTHAPHHVAAQTSAPTIELAYDDGTVYKTIKQSKGGCPDCHFYQGVRFDLGGVKTASITAVRFYAGDGSPSELQVRITDVTRQHTLAGPITVSVLDPKWYTVTVPETLVSDDFWVWIMRTDDNVMPYHDVRPNQRSFIAEHFQHPDVKVWAIPYGNFLIRAVIRAEIHVGEGQDHATIQEAVDAAGVGLVIIVHEGIYNENVVVNKKLTILSKEGPDNTVVSAQNPGASAFTVTANEVTISGFSIQGASGVGAAGVHLDGSTDCMVAANSISNNHYGVRVSTTARNNTVVDNNITSNEYGAWVDGMRTNISGNSMEENRADLGAGVYLSGTAGDNWLHFNRFIAEPGREQVPQVHNDSTLVAANVVNNWWGHATGPYHSSANPGGTGASIGEDVRFSPWLKAEPVAVKSVATAAGAQVVDASDEASTRLMKTGTGTPIVWVARYATNPGGEFPQTPIGNWIDVYFNNTTNVDAVEIQVRYTPEQIAGLNEGSLRLYWSDGTQWKVCSQSEVNITDRFVRARIDPTTTPSLTNLTGTPFVIGTTTAGFAWWWIIVGILAVVFLVVLVRVVLRALPRRSEYYE